MLDDWLRRIASGQRLTTPAVVVRREVYERLGGFDRRITCAGEDWEMWVRLEAHYPVWFEPEPLAVYLVESPGSLTASSRDSARLVADMRLATDIVDSYLAHHLPPRQAASAVRRARTMYSRWAVNAVGDLVADRRLRAVPPQAREALRCRWTPLRSQHSLVQGCTVGPGS